MLELSGWELLRHIRPLSSDRNLHRGYILGPFFKPLLELSRWDFLWGWICERVLELSGRELLRIIGPLSSDRSVQRRYFLGFFIKPVFKLRCWDFLWGGICKHVLELPGGELLCDIGPHSSDGNMRRW